MLYNLPLSISLSGSCAECHSVHHLPDCGREPDGARHKPAPWSVAHQQAPRVPDRPDHPSRRSSLSRAESRNAHDGRAADSDRGPGSDTALGGSPERLYLDRRPLDRRIRCNRIHRRLPQDRSPLPSWPASSLQDARPGLARGVRGVRSHLPCRLPSAAALHTFA